MNSRNFKWEFKDKLPKIKYLWSGYIDKYFDGKQERWFSQAQPYIFYKHIFRKFLYQKVTVKNRIRDTEEILTGKKPDHTTILNSLNQDPRQFKFNTKKLTEILKFLHSHYNNSNYAMFAKTIYAYKDRGYTIEDIARNCMVHKKAIDKILEGKKVPYHILQQIEKQLNHEIS